jgi:selenocysteine-specific elongation factor
MKSVVIGTAGHIDHGKTALVRALTGIDTDRLLEEKRRGITIELGFAHLELTGPQGPVRLGFVDVPGHERFVHTMLAGVCGIDVVLFVISAQESVKPQTCEHLAICRLLQVPCGIIVLTKCDLVDAVTLQVVRMEVEELVKGSFLDVRHTPIVEVSARTGEGLEELKQALVRMASAAEPKDVHAAFRLPVDRVFSMKGFGTVVTGTLISGEVCKEQTVEVLPLGKNVRVRGVHVHGESTDVAVAGQRTALNLVGVPQEELERGMTLAQPGLLRPARRLDVRLTLLPGAPDAKNNSRVHLHLFTAERVAQIVLYEGETLPAGECAWAQLRLASPVPCAPGDRFIVRQFSPVTTVGGGVVVDVNPMRRMKPGPRVALLAELQAGDDLCRLQVLAARRDKHGLRRQDAAYETGWSAERLQRAVGALAAAKEVLCFDDVLIAGAVFERITSEMFDAVRTFQAANPLAGGIGKQEMLTRSGLDRGLFIGAMNSLVQAKRLAVTAEHVHLPDHRVAMVDDEANAKTQIEQAFAVAGITVPALKDVLAGQKIDQTRAQKIVTLLLREKVLVKVSDNLVFHHKTLELLKQQVAELKSQSPKMDVPRFKEIFGVSRKYAIPLLEYLDREHVTRRTGDERIIV